jgi:hypothetical protein
MCISKLFGMGGLKRRSWKYKKEPKEARNRLIIHWNIHSSPEGLAIEA